MNSRFYLKELGIHQEDLITIVVETMPHLSLIDLEKLIMFAEMEIQYRQDTGELDEE